MCSQECKGSGAFSINVLDNLRSNPGVNSQMRVPCGMNWSANNPIPWMGLGAMVVLTNSICSLQKGAQRAWDTAGNAGKTRALLGWLSQASQHSSPPWPLSRREAPSPLGGVLHSHVWEEQLKRRQLCFCKSARASITASATGEPSV